MTFIVLEDAIQSYWGLGGAVIPTVNPVIYNSLHAWLNVYVAAIVAHMLGTVWFHSVAVTRHSDKMKLGEGNAFFHLTFPGHSLSLRKVRAGLMQKP